jgi:hypothetical protein
MIMKKSKILGIIVILISVILILIVLGYTTLFSVFGISSGWSFLMIIPLLIIATILIIALSFLFRWGVKRVKDIK